MAVYKVRVSERYKRLNPPKSLYDITEIISFDCDLSHDELVAIVDKLESYDNWIEQFWEIERLVDVGKAYYIEDDLDD